MKLLIKNRSVILYSCTISLLMSAFSSCKKDLLHTVNPTSIPYESAFATPDRILAQVNRLYAQAKSSFFIGGRAIVYGELRSDEFVVNQPNPITGLEIWTQSANSSTSHLNNIWSAAYLAINSSNLFIQGLNENKDIVTPALFTQYVAEAKFVRALCYTYLIQFYAPPYSSDNGASEGIPLRLKGETTNTNTDLARSTVAEVYNQIISDLNDAEAGLPDTYSTALLNTTRAHKNTATALKTRVYLIRGDYAKVVAEASKIVSSASPFQAATGVNNKLEANITTVFSGTYAGSESMLSFPFSSVDGLGIQASLSYYYSPSPGNGEYYLNPSGILANPVFSNSSDARSLLLTTSASKRWLHKFRSPAPYAEYVPIIRYAEVLLNYAEAAAMTNDLSKASSLLNAVRRRSNPSYTFPNTDISTQNALVNTILTERRIELLGEGFSAFDLLRRLQPLPAKSGPQGVAPSVAPSAPNYIWPIPGDERSTNKLI